MTGRSRARDRSRPSGGAPQTTWLPWEQLGAKLIWWIDPDVGATIASGRIASITDRSGNGHNAVQSTAGSRPLDSTATLGGRTRRIIRCDGSTVCMPVGNAASSARLVAGTGRIYVVYRADSGVIHGNYIFGSLGAYGTTAGIALSPITATTTYAIVGNGSAQIAGFLCSGWTAATWACARFTNSAGAISVRRNGAASGSATASGSLADVAEYPLSLGAGGLNSIYGASTASAFIDFACAFHTTNTLTTEEEAALSAWLTLTYGVAA